MRRFAFTAFVLAAGFLAATAAPAATATTDDSLAIYRDGDIGLLHTTATAGSGLSRMDVALELARARQAGELDLRNRNRTAEPQGMALTRQQVLAELEEARRVGALDHREHNLSPTPAQLEQIRLAGQRALMTALTTR